MIGEHMNPAIARLFQLAPAAIAAAVLVLALLALALLSALGPSGGHVVAHADASPFRWA
jgi:hypothetical protein